MGNSNGEKRKNGTKKRNLLENINDKVNLPAGMLYGGVHIELNSNREMIIDGRCSVLEYTDTSVRLYTRTNIIKISGFSLDIVAMDKNCTEIRGRICGIEFSE